jgi:hypothetical protein
VVLLQAGPIWTQTPTLGGLQTKSASPVISTVRSAPSRRSRSGRSLTKSACSPSVDCAPGESRRQPLRACPPNPDQSRVPRGSARADEILRNHRLILPGDEGYDPARKIWNARYDKHPAMIARCANTDDVRRAVEFGRKNNVLTSVRSGGHDPAGFSTNDDGIVIDLGLMDLVTLAADNRSVSAQPGARVGQLYEELGKHNLTAVSGACPGVGLGGLTTGGGESAIQSMFGTASDNVLAAQVVTADGQVMRVDANENSDLYWAIRGGSGNFGIVTEFVTRAFPLQPITAGSIGYPMSQFRDVLHRVADFVTTIPDEATLAVAAGLPGPPDIVYLAPCYWGDPAKVEQALKPLRFGKPISDDVRVMPGFRGLLEDEPPPGAYSENGVIVTSFGDPAINALSDGMRLAPSGSHCLCSGMAAQSFAGPAPFRFGAKASIPTLSRSAETNRRLLSPRDGPITCTTPSRLMGAVPT